MPPASSTPRTASFILTFAPPPRAAGIEQMLDDARGRGRRAYEPAEFDEIVGEPGFPLR